VAKSLKSRRKSARRPNVFQDRCRQPLGYLSAQYKALLFVHVGVEFMAVEKEKNLDRDVSHPLLPSMKG
jgi:hypothetical protein